MLDFFAWCSIALQGLALYFFGTVAFDVVHWLLHELAETNWPILSTLGEAHCSHHDFLDENLDIRGEHTQANLYWHVIPEFLTRVAATIPFFWLLDPLAVWAVLGVYTVNVAIVAAWQGRDNHHFEADGIEAPGQSPFVDADYHLLHHVYPRNYYASVLRVFDWIAGTGCQLEGRRVTITGSSGAFGEPLVELLREAGVASVERLTYGEDWDYDDYEVFDDVLSDTDILILAHGSKVEDAMDANCRSFVRMIETFRREARDRSVAPEVWAVGSEIESHPHWGDPELEVYKRSKVAYSRRARWYYACDDLLYRHIVPSAFTSPMGRGLISGRTAARAALAIIRRGFEYIPVTYTGIAFLNYPKFLFGINAQPPPDATETPRTTAPPPSSSGAS